MARPRGLFLLELRKVEPKLLSVFFAVLTVVLGVFLLKFLLFVKESLYNRIFWFLQFLQDHTVPGCQVILSLMSLCLSALLNLGPLAWTDLVSPKEEDRTSATLGFFSPWQCERMIQPLISEVPFGSAPSSFSFVLC